MRGTSSAPHTPRKNRPKEFVHIKLHKEQHAILSRVFGNGNAGAASFLQDLEPGEVAITAKYTAGALAQAKLSIAGEYRITKGMFSVKGMIPIEALAVERKA